MSKRRTCKCSHIQEAWKCCFFVYKIVDFKKFGFKILEKTILVKEMRETLTSQIHAMLVLLYFPHKFREFVNSFETEFFRATTSLKRLLFFFLLLAVRFNDITTICQIWEHDQLAPIRLLIKEFVQSCKHYYSLSA